MKRKKTRSPKSNETNEKTNKKRKIDTTDPRPPAKKRSPLYQVYEEICKKMNLEPDIAHRTLHNHEEKSLNLVLYLK